MAESNEDLKSRGLVIVRVPYTTGPNQAIAINGSGELGDWKRPIVGQDVDKSPSTWEVRMDVIRGRTYWWKLVLVDPRTSSVLRWEETPNRELRTEWRCLILEAPWGTPATTIWLNTAGDDVESPVTTVSAAPETPAERPPPSRSWDMVRDLRILNPPTTPMLLGGMAGSSHGKERKQEEKETEKGSQHHARKIGFNLEDQGERDDVRHRDQQNQEHHKEKQQQQQQKEKGRQHDQQRQEQTQHEQQEQTQHERQEQTQHKQHQQEQTQHERQQQEHTQHERPQQEQTQHEQQQQEQTQHEQQQQEQTQQQHQVQQQQQTEQQHEQQYQSQQEHQQPKQQKDIKQQEPHQQHQEHEQPMEQREHLQQPHKQERNIDDVIIEIGDEYKEENAGCCRKHRRCVIAALATTAVAIIGGVVGALVYFL